jgi:hypothetical protein
MATDEMRVEFRITGFSCSPRLVSDALNVGATDSWEAGDSVAGSAIKRSGNGWVLRLAATGLSPLEQRVSQILTALPENLAVLKRVTVAWDAQLSCAVYTHGDIPELSLASSQVARLAELGASIDIDVMLVE